MLLKRIEVSGFRGIKRLSLTFDELTVLIGENAWGKSSLLDALSIALSPDAHFYNFKFSDFHVDYAAGHEKMAQLQIVIHFCEDYPGEHNARRYKAFTPLWVDGEDAAKELYYQINSIVKDDKIITHRSFLDNNGKIIHCPDTDRIAKQLMTLHPIVRIRDARRLRREAYNGNGNGNGKNGNGNGKSDRDNSENARIQRRLDNTCQRLMTRPGHVSSDEIKSSINALRTLVDHYFAFAPHNRPSQFNRVHFPSWAQYTKNPLEQLTQPHMTKQARLILMGLLNAFIRARGPVELKRLARPIMILEDPEGRLHPTLLQQAWTFISNMPMQKILTTNSSDLTSVVPLQSINKLIREPDRTHVYNISPRMLSRDEERRVAFHVRLHRPNALFARAWLLVEGETEVWLFNEFARICGYNLAAEGVQIIEFAQSGLRPLIKVARGLGIEWHLVADGDLAGKKYAETVRHLLGNDAERHRLTVLPCRDIEHFLFKHGFEPLFRKLASIPHDSPVTPKKIIARALKRHAKPDVALAIVEFTDEENVEEIPVLLRWILKRIVVMSRGVS
ncbi:ATP-dependent endonuclease [Photobacterium sp. J15]|uniref:ATP-dependent endonuclease n=1 Tax=Photobacterium sp. J15 TaxID=265901 RepID=UPI0007E2FE1E|nr:ATP-dependent endonuclease [Photobacterium sp. J15]